MLIYHLKNVLDVVLNYSPHLPFSSPQRTVVVLLDLVEVLLFFLEVFSQIGVVLQQYLVFLLVVFQLGLQLSQLAFVDFYLIVQSSSLGLFKLDALQVASVFFNQSLVFCVFN